MTNIDTRSPYLSEIKVNFRQSDILRHDNGHNEKFDKEGGKQMELRPVHEWREDVTVVLKSKQNEFEMLGYKEITVDGIWHCLMENIWKEDEPKRLYEVVQSIFQLQIHTYMDYLAIDSLHTLSQEKDDELMASINAVLKRED